MSGGRTGVSQKLPLRTPTQSPTKNIIKYKNHKKNHKTQNNKKNTKYKNPNKNSTILQSVPIFSANGAGVVNKIESLVNSVTKIGAGLITLQETHFKSKGRLKEKLPQYELQPNYMVSQYLFKWMQTASLVLRL